MNEYDCNDGKLWGLPPCYRPINEELQAAYAVDGLAGAQRVADEYAIILSAARVLQGTAGKMSRALENNVDVLPGDPPFFPWLHATEIVDFAEGIYNELAVLVRGQSYAQNYVNELPD